ncbi:MAG TPA: class I SAM-dependent methyltransferase [Solirubrobacterales bacterium]|nr:class I SAM-dependent methyltransferase [Solirubrobacterales bacterium]
MDFDPNAYREQSLAIWGKMAPAWRARNEWMIDHSGLVNDWIVGRADPRPGNTVLDIAAGPGDLGFRVAERVGGSGRVISADFAPEMVDVARRLGQARGLGNVDYMVLDAERMSLESDSVDAVVCRWGYMLMADSALALRETRRVLREGGPLAFAVWAPPARNPWAAVPAKILVQQGRMPAPQPGGPGMFAMGDPDRVRELVEGAGFGVVELEEIAFQFRYPDSDDLWDFLIRMAGPIAGAVEELSPEEQVAARAAVMESMAPYREEDGSYTAPALSLGVLVR